MPLLLTPPKVAWDGLIKMISEHQPGWPLFRRMAEEHPVYTALEWQAWYGVMAPDLIPQAVKLNPEAYWLQPEKGGHGNPLVREEEEAMVRFVADWDGLVGEGWVKFAEMKKPRRSAQSWAQNWRFRKDELMEEVEKLRAAKAKVNVGVNANAKSKSKAKAPPKETNFIKATRMAPATKRKESPASEDTKTNPVDEKVSGSHKKPRTSSTSSAAGSSKEDAHTPHLTSISMDDVYPFADAATGSNAASTSKSQRPKPELKHYLAMVELLVKEGVEPRLPAFIKFCEQEQNKELQFNEWMELYRDHQDKLIHSATFWRDVVD